MRPKGLATLEGVSLDIPQDNRTVDVTADVAQERELAQLIVTTLKLKIEPSDVDPEAPLYKEGLGLDSIDILEISLTISKVYGFKLSSDDENNLVIFRSLRSLNRHIQTHRVK